MTTTSSPPRIGVLGGPGTCTYQATERLLSAYPELGEDRSYYSSVDGVWDSLAGGEVDVIIVMEQTSKFGWNLARERVAPPGVPRSVHRLNSVEAAKEVAAGDGTKGVVATMLTAELTGLEPLARGIDA